MIQIGNITGREIEKYKDGDVNRLLLQVKFLDDDIQQVELINQHGEDVNPADGCRVLIIDITEAYQAAIAITDDLEPEVDPGEKEIYSTDSPVTTKLARIKLDADGNIVHNQGAKSVVTHAELNIALQNLITLLMTHVHTSAAPGNPTSVPTAPITIDISGAESPTIKVP
jgi:delta 1-pyrroline-5-carboxylate dehydrogenase